MEQSWVESSYKALEFLFWEPQHLGKKRNPDSAYSSVDEVFDHLRDMEVTLNQHLFTLLLLAPQSVRRTLFKQVFSSCPSSKHKLLTHVESDYACASEIQPDFFFASDTSDVGLEMKIKAKSSIGQFLKYVLLGLAQELKSRHRMAHYIGFIGRDDFASLWKEGYRTPDEVRKAARKDVGSFLHSRGSTSKAHHLRFIEILETVDVGFITYSGLAAVLKKSRPSTADKSDGAYVYRNLIDGLIADLRGRKLI